MTQLVATSTLGTPADTYIYSLARCQDDQTLACIASDDSLRLFDPERLQLLKTVSNCNAGTSCLESFETSSSTFLTAGRDGRIVCWDVSGRTTGFELREPKGAGLSALASQGHYIAAGSESTKEGLGDVSVLLWDARNPSTPLRSYVESHNDTITQLAFHPSRPEILLSGSTDGLVSLFDINVQDEDDALVQVLNPRSAVHCAGFLTAGEAYVVSSDEEFWVYDLDLERTEVTEDVALPVKTFGDIREALSCRYVIDVFPGLSSPVMAVGNNDTQRLALYPLKPSWSFGEPIELLGAHGDDVVRDVLVDESRQRMITCGEDGTVRSWAYSAANNAGDAMEVDSGVKSGKKAKRKEKKAAERFAPY